jgi:hypothetical protein
MSKRRASSPRRCPRRLGAMWAVVMPHLLGAWRALRCHMPATRVEVLAADRTERRRLEREIRAALQRLERVAGPTLGCHAAVLVQRTVQSSQPVAGCALVSRGTEFQRFALIRLATQVGGRALALDEILAALAELWIRVASDQLASPAVLVPVELGPAPVAPRAVDPLPADPLAPRTNGHVSVHSDRAA